MRNEGDGGGPTTILFARLPLDGESGLCRALLTEGEVIYGLHSAVLVRGNALEAQIEEAGRVAFSLVKALHGHGRPGREGQKRAETF